MTDEWIDRKIDRRPRCQLVLGYMHGQATTTVFSIHCPLENPLSTPVISCTSPSPFAVPCMYPLCHFSAPSIQCTYPLSSLAIASLCHPLYTHCHPKSSPVIPCTCHPCLPRHPLHVAGCSVMCCAHYT
mgnify:CR=1 FL=1